VIDGGIDTAHVDLRPVLWRNERERGGTGRDDDGNGYVDDLRGWNFIGGASGENVHHDTFELTRLYAACGVQRRNGGAASAVGMADCDAIAEAYAEKRTEVTQTLAQIENIGRALDGAVTVLKTVVTEELTKARVEALQTTSPQVTQARQLFLQLDANGITPTMLDEARTAYGSQARYGLDTLFDPRSIVGDNYTDGSERRYGNSDIAGPDAKHGSHVAGIIAAVRGNGEGLDGVTDGVRVMGVRAVPDGDERCWCMLPATMPKMSTSPPTFLPPCWTTEHAPRCGSRLAPAPGRGAPNWRPPSPTLAEPRWTCSRPA